jgi:erythromycin esterase
VTGLGEAAHGSSTLFKLKTRLFRYLVENSDCRALLYEYNYRESLILNRYVCNGIGDLDSLMYDIYWIQANNEIKELLEWMREYNSQVSKEKMIQFLGFDCQLDMFRPERLKEEFKELDTFLASLMEKELDWLASLGKPQYRGMDKALFKEIDSRLLKLKRDCESYFTTRPAENSMEQITILNLVECMRRSHEFLFNAYNGGPNNRDHFMAQNVLRMKKSLFPGKTPIALWAHNSHLSVNRNMYPDLGPSMGYYLRESLGREYLICGTSFNKGEVTAVETDPLTGKDTPPHTIRMDTTAPAESVNHLLSLCRYDNFVLPLNRLDIESPLFSYLDTVRGFLGIGDWFRGSTTLHYLEDRMANIARAYDIIFHIDEIKPITPSGKWAKTEIKNQ